ncbi:hypothetical protein HMPREF0454_02529 [Hafnia alvei ATCC 51873]|uniref:Uncharacterized protein n=1 Tax=Hafnia alvei ATCC 51873 TaxID=1002364 RepID=G9Y7H5_HAFAL|nr:hypothetical protein HMPREF0454_02529 [Hafnia alvei ATCC 51873]
MHVLNENKTHILKIKVRKYVHKNLIQSPPPKVKIPKRQTVHIHS